MENTICPITGEKTNRKLDFSTDYYMYNLNNLFVSYEIFRDMLEDNTKIDIEEKTKLAGKLANFSMNNALRKGITHNLYTDMESLIDYLPIDQVYPIYSDDANKPIKIGLNFLEKVKQESIPSLNKRIELFLLFLSNAIKIIPEIESQSLEDKIILMVRLKAVFKAISYTENRDWDNFIIYLSEKNFIRHNSSLLSYSVTIEGQEFLKEKRKNQESKKVFVAMWFNEKVNFIYEQAVEPAIRECSYDPVRIDRVEHNNIIDDEIIANIKQSKFIIADFTAEKDKPRGGVYYEAGFAHGFGIPVIFTCRKDLIENKEIHFDLEHRNFIWWEENKMEDFKNKLIYRIKATID